LDLSSPRTRRTQPAKEQQGEVACTLGIVIHVYRTPALTENGIEYYDFQQDHTLFGR
jgi:hypothetical protein